MIKEKVKDTLFTIQNQIIIDLKERLLVNAEMVDIDENDTLDPEDYSHQNESTEMSHLLEIQLQKAEHELERLSHIDFSNKVKIEIGSIVKTEQFSFVVSIATTPFQVDNEQFVGISIDAPIYASMKDKVNDDEFAYGNNHYKIISII
jgi:hypothetical protein